MKIWKSTPIALTVLSKHLKGRKNVNSPSCLTTFFQYQEKATSTLKIQRLHLQEFCLGLSSFVFLPCAFYLKKMIAIWFWFIYTQLIKVLCFRRYLMSTEFLNLFYKPFYWNQEVIFCWHGKSNYSHLFKIALKSMNVYILQNDFVYLLYIPWKFVLYIPSGSRELKLFTKFKTFFLTELYS